MSALVVTTLMINGLATVVLTVGAALAACLPGHRSRRS